MSEVTRLLEAVAVGDRTAAAAILPLVYDELRKLAAARLAAESTNQTLDATSLVHEAYLRLVGDQQFDNRGHFFAAAAEAMRRILVDSARRKKAIKHGGGRQRIPLQDVQDDASDADASALLALDDALRGLSDEDPVAAQIVERRYFAGMGYEEIAATLGVSEYLVRQKWTYAKAWLRVALGE